MTLYSHATKTPLVRGPLNLVAGLSWLFKRPKFLLLGAVPAVLAGAIILAATVAVAYFSGGIAGHRRLRIVTVTRDKLVVRE